MAEPANPDPSNPGTPGTPPAATPPATPPATTPDPPDPGIKGRISDLTKTIKELETKLKTYEEKDKQAADQKAIEEGKIKEVLAAKEKELADARTKLDSTTKVLEEYENTTKAQVQKGLEGIKDEKKRQTVAKLLDGKTPAQQAQLLPELLEAIGTSAPAGFGNNPPATPPANPGTPNAKFEEFKKLYDKQKTAKLTPEEERKYFQLSRDPELNKLIADEQEKRRREAQARADDGTANHFA